MVIVANNFETASDFADKLGAPHLAEQAERLWVRSTAICDGLVEVARIKDCETGPSIAGPPLACGVTLALHEGANANKPRRRKDRPIVGDPDEAAKVLDAREAVALSILLGRMWDLVFKAGPASKMRVTHQGLSGPLQLQHKDMWACNI